MLEQFLDSFKEITNWEICQVEILNNTYKTWVVAILVFFGLLIVFALFQMIILRHFKKLAKRTKTDIDDTLIEVIKTIRPPFYSFLAFYLALRFLTLHGWTEKGIGIILIVWVVFLVIKALEILIDYIVGKGMKKGEERSKKAAIDALGKVIKGILWVIGLLLILSNLGVNITSLVAGLGIGGIAIAFALQNILGDLFSSFAIYFDKPFVPGDFIIIGDSKGTVEKIGIKTTRLKSIQGEELVVSNRELTSARIRNFRKMKERRISFGFGVVYETPSTKLKKIPAIVRKVVKSVKLARIDRVHFKKFDDSALTFEVVYYAESDEYIKYMDIQQDINFKIKHEFEKEGISMAYPTQTIYLAKEDA